MKKIIKFRAFDKRKSLMHAVVRIDFDNPLFNVQILCPTEIAPQNWELRKFDEVELMQFAGLTDKNGVEIYDGDICQIVRRKNMGYNEEGPRILGAVEFGEFGAKDGGIYRFTGFHINQCSIHHKLKEDFEVIGNIYENPELLTNE